MYLTLIPNYTQSCIRDDFNGIIDINMLNLPKELIDEINIWHMSYRVIIPLSVEQRQLILTEIEKLDEQGILIAKLIKKKSLGNTKIKYFSEGKLKYLSVD
ncbi:MAG: hypothetical protein U5L45_14600 [Saprospiraceae bacterium]|nr:hypothetical protein [Saprospiraceae bacterium]